ncbi:MAG: hypothetical protein A3E79_17770 [Burkholderiales bacterium RIFCSPHIGHO2_12_FULL_61_11]|nr:MAG: hypothetical protein A3E79_17770 [Burkholderiales bacterium RIFCSPHIGHO2_12_FULL_61_11]
MKIPFDFWVAKRPAPAALTGFQPLHPDYRSAGPAGLGRVLLQGCSTNKNLKLLQQLGLHELQNGRLRLLNPCPLL